MADNFISKIQIGSSEYKIRCEYSDILNTPIIGASNLKLKAQYTAATGTTADGGINIFNANSTSDSTFTITGSAGIKTFRTSGTNTVTIMHDNILSASGTTSPNHTSISNLNYGSSFYVPVISYNKTGHITGVSTASYKLNFADNKVTQSPISTEGKYPILLKHSIDTTEETNTTNFIADFSINPYSKELYGATIDAIVIKENSVTLASKYKSIQTAIGASYTVSLNGNALQRHSIQQSSQGVISVNNGVDLFSFKSTPSSSNKVLTESDISGLVGAMVYKGTTTTISNNVLGTNPTISGNPVQGWTFVASSAVSITSSTRLLGKSMATTGAVEVGDMFVYNGTNWNIISGENQVSNSNPTLSFGSSHTLGTIDGTNFTVTMPANPNLNQKIKVGNTSFGEDDTISLVNGTNITITPDTTSKTITINAPSNISAFTNNASYATVSQLSNYLPLAGGSMNYGAAITLRQADAASPYMILSGGYIQSVIPSTVYNGWARGIFSKTIDSASNYYHLGWYGDNGPSGTGTGLIYTYLGGDYGNHILRLNKSNKSSQFFGTVKVPNLASGSYTYTMPSATGTLALQNDILQSDHSEVDSASKTYIKAKPYFSEGTYTTYIPVKYQQLDYSSVLSYSGTGPSVSTRVNYQDGFEATITTYCQSATTYWWLLGSADYNGSGTSIGIGGGTNGSIYIRHLGTTLVTSSITRVVGHIYTISMKFKDGTASLYVRDETTGTEGYDTATYESLPALECILWRHGGNRMSSGNKVYNLEIWVNGEKKVHFIPIHNTESDNYGFWNAITTASIPSHNAMGYIGGGNVVKKSPIISITNTNTDEKVKQVPVYNAETISNYPILLSNIASNGDTYTGSTSYCTVTYVRSDGSIDLKASSATDATLDTPSIIFSRGNNTNAYTDWSIKSAGIASGTNQPLVISRRNGTNVTQWTPKLSIYNTGIEVGSTVTNGITSPKFIKTDGASNEVLLANGDAAIDNSLDGQYFPNAVKDYDGNWYNAVVIGNQVWMTENMNTTHFSNGTEIAGASGSVSTSVPFVTDTPYYFDYIGFGENDNYSYRENVGLLYNWCAAMNSSTTEGARGIAPSGWHIPTDAEYQQLMNYVSSQARYVDSTFDIGRALAAQDGWSGAQNTGLGYNTYLNNATGWSGKPGGYKVGTSGNSYVSFNGYWWTSTPGSTTDTAQSYRIAYSASPYFNKHSDISKTQYRSVRCISDKSPLEFREWYFNTYNTLQHVVDTPNDIVLRNSGVADATPSIVFSRGEEYPKSGAHYVDWLLNANNNGLMTFSAASNMRSTKTVVMTLATNALTLTSASVVAASFIKDGGTSSQFLKADGSVDSNVYITSAALPTVNNAVLTVSGSGLTISTASTFSANASTNQTITITHPTQTSYSSGLYKITTNGTGHVTGATAVTTSDITGLSGWPSYALTSQIPDVSDYVTKSTYQIITASKRFTSNIELYHASSDTPAIIFQRGNSTNYYDWKMYNDGSGIFRIQCNRNTGSFANHITINADGFFDSNLPLRTSSSVVATGSVAAASFIKTGATTTNVLQAGGGDIALATVATTGSYSDLSGLPTIPTVPSFSSLGSTKVPIYLSSTNTFSACASFASGTSITLNGAIKAAQTAAFYAPINSGTSGYLLKSSGANSSPEWIKNALTINTLNDSGVNFASNDTSMELNPFIGNTLIVQASNHWIKTGMFEGKGSPILGIAHETSLKPLSLGSNDKFSYGVPIRIPIFDVDEAGHITKGDDTLITIPEPKDEKVKQSPSTTTSWKKILLSCNTVSTNTASITADLASIAYYSNALSVKPSTGEIKAGGFIKDANSTNILLANGSSIAQSTFSTTDEKVKQVLSSLDVYGRLLITSNNSGSSASGSITNNAVAYAYYTNSIMANPSTGDVVSTSYRANGNNVYIGASTTSQCHQQYDATNKCLKFIFD